MKTVTSPPSWNVVGPRIQRRDRHAHDTAQNATRAITTSPAVARAHTWIARQCPANGISSNRGTCANSQTKFSKKAETATLTSGRSKNRFIARWTPPLVSSVRILDTVRRISDTEASVMSSRRAITILALAVWVLLGPVAMVFAGCAAMGAMCEGPCGAAACVVLVQAMSIAPEPVSCTLAAADTHPLATTLAGVEHPPRSLFFSA